MSMVFWLAGYGIVVTFVLGFLVRHQRQRPAREEEQSAIKRRPYVIGGRTVHAPAVAFQDAKFRGMALVLRNNMSNMGGFTDISSIKVSKGATVTLFSEPNWQGRELLIDTDAEFLGGYMNDRVRSVSVEDSEPVAHAVLVYRVGSSMLVEGEDMCPPSLMCWPAATLPEVADSVYMGSNRMLLDGVGRKIGCQVNKFMRHDGVRLYGVLPSKVYAMCVSEQWVFPAEPKGHELQVNVPSLGGRVKIESLSILPRVYRAFNLFTPEECDRIVQEAISREGDQGNAIILEPTAANSATRAAVLRASELAKVPEQLAAPMLVRRYAEGENLELHRDSVDPRENPAFVGPNNRNRFVTVLIYLSDAEVGDGGETNFPLAKDLAPLNGAGDRGELQSGHDDCSQGLRVRPRKGDALLFYSLLSDAHVQGVVDKYSLHGSCQLKKGHKWVANVMFHNKVSLEEEMNQKSEEREQKEKRKDEAEKRHHLYKRGPFG